MNPRTEIVSPKRLAELHPDLFSVPTLQRWRSAGIGPKYVVLGPRRIAYRLADIEAWMSARIATSTADARTRNLTAA